MKLFPFQEQAVQTLQDKFFILENKQRSFMHLLEPERLSCSLD